MVHNIPTNLYEKTPLAFVNVLGYIILSQCHHVVHIESFVARLMRVVLRERADANTRLVSGTGQRHRHRNSTDDARRAAAVTGAGSD